MATASGIDLFLKYGGFLRTPVSGWISYSYIHARRLQARDLVETIVYEEAPSSFDITHNLTVVGKAQLTQQLSVGLTFRCATGAPVTPVAGAIRADGADYYEPIQGPLNSERMPASIRLDATLSYFQPFGESNSVIFYLGVTNVLNRANAVRYEYSADYTQPAAQNDGLPPVHLLWNISFPRFHECRGLIPYLSNERNTMKTRMILAVLTLLATGTAHSQTQGTRQSLLEAKNCLRTADNTALVEDYARAKGLLNTCTAGDEYQCLAEYYLGYADYRLGVVVYRMDKEKAIVYLDSAVGHLEKALEKEDGFAEAHALLSSCYGIKISHAPFKAIVLGPRSGKEMQKARDLSPGNPRIALLEGIGTYNTPALFGGGKEKGLEALKKAAELFERWKTADSLQPDWGSAEVYAWIGIAYRDRNETILARKAFESALRINPDYGWVKYGLLPKVTSETGVQ